ncbi:MocR-like pyridoxine biosynthesis transcription factor PdxR [Litoreibacter roseus]|uniref:GntR family transcriptional regulator n=1 Tax=Litoreibacter roseus TaxID=2601869 RepID=A0A6N6JNN3_9RHOB|nr:PLP-dependent aminotransferase family protein [Litoreibacter roseus]GFE67068.1 GntR family transcriptional regulator [Litoreibacter roseus]
MFRVAINIERIPDLSEQYDTMTEAFLDDLLLDRAARETLAAQLAGELRKIIVAGTLSAGSKLPSSRVLSKQLSVGRNVVTEAYDALISEGLVDSIHGAGSFVAEGSNSTASNPRRHPRSVFSEATRVLLQRADAWALPDPHLALTPGIPALDEFPTDQWSRCLSKALRTRPSDYVLDTDTRGLLALREAIAAHVGPARGISCHPEQIIVLSSARQAFEIVTRLFSDPGDTVLVENPGFVEAREIALALGRRIQPCPVDTTGIQLPQGEGSAKLAFLTPTHQYPTGQKMPPKRMLEVIKECRDNSVIIVEDDYDGEFHHYGKPSRALAAQDELVSAIHIGTFSKSMFPGLRLAYVIVPYDCAPAFGQMRGLLDGQPSTVLQAGMAEFIRSGNYARHLRRMRKLYAARKAALLETVQHFASDVLDPISSNSGLHLCFRASQQIDDTAVVRSLRQSKIGATALSGYHVERINADHGLVLGFGNTSEKTYAKHITTIANALKVAL